MDSATSVRVVSRARRLCRCSVCSLAFPQNQNPCSCAAVRGACDDRSDGPTCSSGQPSHHGSRMHADVEELQLALRCHDQRIIFAPLTALTHLRALQIHAAQNQRSALPSDEQVAALRQMHSLEEFDHNFTDRNGTLGLLLQALTDSASPLDQGSGCIGRRCSRCVAAAASLSHRARREMWRGDVELLLSLPRVVTLTLHSVSRGTTSEDLTRIVTTLQRCPQITSLCLECSVPISSAHLSALLPCLPRLSSVRCCSHSLS